FLGKKLYERYRSPFNLDIPWGWKSTVSIFIFPLWLDLFPNAKVLYIHRNGIVVARSMKRAKEEADRGFKNWVDSFMQKPRSQKLTPPTNFASLLGVPD